LRPSLSDLAAKPFDVIVVGGGINGTGIAREAQRHGYRTLLIERNDFGAGTTSRATRLIHGGLRYLEHGEFALVYESLHEREELVREAAHLVRPLRMLVPVYKGDKRPPWNVRIGLAMYDLLSLRKSLPRHRAMPPRAIDAYEPGLSRDGLRAAYTMYDAQVEFPERLVIESLRDFINDGGTAMNHAVAERIISPGGLLRGLVLRDELCSDVGAQHAAPDAADAPTVEVEARCIVNAAGPWADDVLRGSDAERHDRLIGGTKGSHLVVEWPDGPKHAIFASAKEDGRPFFILPWYRYTLIGTTDLRHDGDPSDARCTTGELRYLLDEANRLFPRAPLTREDVLYTYSGVRPLPYTPGGDDESTISRSHFVIDHQKRGGPDGLLSIVGGKLTTYRSLARVALKAIEKHTSPSGEAAPVGSEEGWRKEEGQSIPSSSVLLPSSARTADDPLHIYGPRANEVRALIASDAALAATICEHNPEILAQVAYAVDSECAVTLADVLLRRLRVGWSACHALDGAERAASVMAQRLGGPPERIAREVSAYERELRETLVPVDELASK
jgi:glycerol-3-phosphate dehydrogenase